MFLLFLLYALFGFTFTLGKITLFYARPFFIIATRMLIGGTGLYIYLHASKHIQCYPRMKDWASYMQVSLFGIFIPYSLRAWGLQYISSTKAAFIFTLMPFFTALFAYAINREKLSYQKSTGLIIGFLGMMPTLFTSNSLEEMYGSIGFLSLPELAIIGSVASFGYNLIALQKLVKHRGCPAVLANSISMLMGGFLALNAAVLFEPVWITTGSIGIFIALLAVQIVISNLICANLQAWLLHHYSPTLMAFAGFLTPLCAAFYGWLLLNEQLYLNYVISFFLVLLGLIIFYYDEVIKRRKIAKSMLLDSSEF
jgi:drug/metabolite transporter (DMT)-like permease